MSRRPARPPPLVRSSILAASLALSACSAAAPEPIACEERSQCPADALCRDGACVRSAAPLALIAAADAVPRANRVIAFDAAGSRDPDAEDQVVAYAWTSKRVDASCDPTAVEAQGPRFRVLFPCAGAFRVELTVTDSAGIVSAPATMALKVAPDDVAPPAVRVGEPLALDHVCGGEPLECTPLAESGATTFAVSAVATGGRGNLALRWTANPPPGLASQHSVAFSDASSASTIVTLRSAGAIAGDWTFNVMAIDADGRAALATQTVTLRNRPPVAVAQLSPVLLQHRFDAAKNLFSAEGPLPVARFEDPDGDPVAVRMTLDASGDGGHGMIAADGVVSVAIPGAEPQHLIGGAVARRVVFAADDANGGVAEVEAPVQVLNRAPRLSLVRSAATVPHRYDAGRRVYGATATMSEYVDDDGDPILPGEAVEVGSRGCSSLAMVGKAVQVNCEVPLSTVAALSTLAGAHVLDITVRDPWAHSAPAAARIEVTNAAPKVAISVAPLMATYLEDSVLSHCCEKVIAELCERPPTVWGPASVKLWPVTDADNDPLDVTYEPSSMLVQASRTSATACLGDPCSLELQAPATGNTLSCQAVPDLGTLRITVTDGVGSAEAIVPAQRYRSN